MISIVIPTYNRAALIGETIKSILKQSYSDWELLIVDDDSLDNTSSVVNAYSTDERIKYLKRPKNRKKGGNAARNYGFQLSKGRYIKWLDSDDLLAPHCLEKQIKFMIDGKFDVVFSRSRFFRSIDDKGQFIWDKYWSKSFPLKDPFNNYLLGKIRFSTADGLWKRSFLQEKPFKEDLKNSQEWLMLISELAKDPKYYIDSEVLVYSRMHVEQMHNKKNTDIYYKHQVLARFYGIKKLIEKQKLTNENFKYLLKNMILNVLAPIRKGSFQYFLSNLTRLFSVFFLGINFLIRFSKSQK